MTHKPVPEAAAIKSVTGDEQRTARFKKTNIWTNVSVSSIRVASPCMNSCILSLIYH